MVAEWSPVKMRNSSIKQHKSSGNPYENSGNLRESESELRNKDADAILGNSKGERGGVSLPMCLCLMSGRRWPLAHVAAR